jgi:hypothetical protein
LEIDNASKDTALWSSFREFGFMQRLMSVDILLKVDRRLALVIEPTGDDKLLKVG